MAVMADGSAAVATAGAQGGVHDVQVGAAPASPSQTAQHARQARDSGQKIEAMTATTVVVGSGRPSSVLPEGNDGAGQKPSEAKWASACCRESADGSV